MKLILELPERQTDTIAADFFTEDVGLYLDVEGSRCSRLEAAKDTLNSLCEQIPESHVAKQVRMTNALRDMRIFKDVCGARVVRPSRSKAASSYLQELGVSGKGDALKLGETFSNLRATRALISGARGCLAEDNKPEAKQIFGIIDNFMKSVKAPASARAGAKTVARSMGL